jgi:hypothetical protein
MSGLDRMLILDIWLEVWGTVSWWGLKCGVSDHCSLVVRHDEYDWGSKPFRFYNHWLNNKISKSVVEKEYDSYQVNGWIWATSWRRWNTDVYESVYTKIGALTDEIEYLKLKKERNELVERKTKFNQLWLLLKSKDSLEF